MKHLPACLLTLELEHNYTRTGPALCAVAVQMVPVVRREESGGAVLLVLNFLDAVQVLVVHVRGALRNLLRIALSWRLVGRCERACS